MSGSIGPTVTLQTPSAPLVSAGSVVRHSQNTVTLVAFGARTRNVTRLSAVTSGERTGGGWAGCCACTAAVSGSSMSSARSFISLLQD